MCSPFETCKKWLSVIEKEIIALSIERHIFEEVRKIVKSNKKIQKPSSFYDFLAKSYATTAIIGIRRQLDMDKRSISFARFLNFLATTPKSIKRQDILILYEKDEYSQLNGQDIWKKYADKSGKYFNDKIAATDLRKLEALTKTCKKYANKRIAHYDKKGYSLILRFNDIDKSINFMEKLLKKYTLLFYASSLTHVLPAWQYNWKEIFEEPWIAKDEKPKQWSHNMQKCPLSENVITTR